MKYLPLLALLCASPAMAQQNNMCVPRALGVPTRDGPPDWVRTRHSAVNGAALPPNDALDDPRWLGATGQTIALGSAKAPLQARALYSAEDIASVPGVTKFLYLSFIIDLDGYYTGANVAPRDLFLGFHRPGSPTGEHGYVFQFHLSGSVAGATANGMMPAPVACDDYAACDEDASTTPHDYWRVFRDLGNPANYDCSGVEVGGRMFEPPTSGTTAAMVVPWMAAQDAVRYWKVSVGDPSPFTQNRWAVQIRVPIVAADATKTSNIGNGVEDGSSVFYEATGRLTSGPSNGTFAPIGWYPMTPSMRPPICTNTGSNNLISAEMSDPVNCVNCQLTHLAALSDLGVGTPVSPACDAGFDIDADHVGVLNAAIPGIETIGPGAGMTHLDKTFSGAATTATPVVNHVIALPVNTSTSQIKSRIQGRFRLAEWGSEPWQVSGDLGQWKDIRGADNGVCGTPPPPPSGNPADPPPPICGETDIAAGKHALLTFDWTIGGDRSAGGIGASEYCEFGLKPPNPNEQCLIPKCSCVAPQVCDPNTGVQAAKDGSATPWPCVPSYYQFDQCMLVELNSPNAPATFVHQSIWSNMRFGEMSTLAHEALIDARHLPTTPGQLYQDIYFVAVPRNMPQSLPATSTSVQLAQNAALNLALHVAQPYLDDLDRNPQIPIKVARRAPFATIGIGKGGDGDPRIQQILRARAVMSDADVARVDGLLTVAVSQSQDAKPSAALVHAAVGAVGSSTAAELVPTLDIYPYYQALGKGRAYLPMTSFSLFLSHENTLSGIRYQIDGADQVGANIYHMQIPVGFARKLQVRAQAITSGEAALPPGMPKWPCTGGCAACGGGNRNCGLVSLVGNGIPAVIAGVLVVRRRRRKPAPANGAKAAPPAAR